MENYNTGNYDIYKDINARTGGEIYLGIVGPVRTGKSTFIKRFMDLLVIPGIEDVHKKERAIDELPQSAAGKTIMTTEPKFIPKEAAELALGDDIKVSIRMIDCVGYMVEGASGHTEDDKERMVKTPWFPNEIPFTKAAEIGTKKVITDHSTIGIVVTTDGSFGELPRDAYVAPEERTINELKKLGKPFIVLLNTQTPYSAPTQELRDSLAEKHGVSVLSVNCEQLRKDDITHIMEEILHAFPVSELHFFFPKWVEMLSNGHYLKQSLIQEASRILQDTYYIRDIAGVSFSPQSEYIKNIKLDSIDMQTGIVSVSMALENELYYSVLSDLTGMPIKGEYQFMTLLKDLVKNKVAYEKVVGACDEVNNKGYSIITPIRDDIKIDTPEVIKHGNKYGVKIKATAPSIHMINANIETEIAPIVGTEDQAQDLIRYIDENSRDNPAGIWDTNIFGKSILELVEDGIHTKVNRLSDDSRLKLQDSMQKIVNESNGGLICIII